MSEFTSLLDSFKKNAAAAATSSKSMSSSLPTPSSNSSLKPLFQKPNEEEPRHRGKPHQTASNRKRPLSPSQNDLSVSHDIHVHVPSTRSRFRGKSSFDLSFLVIGGQKCGTTWLHTMLKKSDRIGLPPHQKEVHFWDWHYGRGMDWYIRQFDDPPKWREKSKELLYGEITPCYVVLPPSRIAEIAEEFPRVKIIFVARDMVERAWSALIMELRDQSAGLNPGEFASDSRMGGKDCKMVTSSVRTSSHLSVAQQRRLQQISSPSSQPDSYYMERLRDATHDSRSDYATHLEHWFKYFPSESILIINYKDIESDPRGALRKVVSHIGIGETESGKFVDGLGDDEVRRRVNAAVNVSLGHANSSEFGKESSKQEKATDLKTSQSTSHFSLSQRPRLKKQMEDYLRPYAVKFNKLLKEKGYHWVIDEY